MYFLKDPGESLFLALDTSIKDPITKITVVTLIAAIDTISLTSKNLFLDGTRNL